MSLIKKLTPINLLEEKEKFFADESYNPQFIYEENVPPETLLKYGQPRKEYAQLATEILDKAFYKKDETDLIKLEGVELTQEEVTNKIVKFLEMHRLENRYKIIWSSSFISRTTITSDSIKLRLPVNFRQKGLVGMLYHEIGTHALRRVNYEEQPWFKKKNQLKFKNYLLTEEGLSVLHSLIPQSLQLAYKPASFYLTSYFAQTHSFAELWQEMKKYIPDPEKRWIRVIRQKRGLEDTSQPGGFTKDLVYLEGLIVVWKWLQSNDFDPTQLYFGKMAVEDVQKAVKMNPNFKPQLPSFFLLDKNQYQKDIKQIGQANLINQIQL
jgi:hypothetical protein